MAKLFIVGFPRDMDEIMLVEMFSVHGTVNTVTIITDKLSGESKGYGFVTLTDDIGAERAIAALDGLEIEGRILNVRFAEERSVQAPLLSSGMNRPARLPSPRRENRTETPRTKRPRRNS